MNPAWTEASRQFAREAFGVMSQGLDLGESPEDVMRKVDTLVDSYVEPPAPLTDPVLKRDDEQRIVWGWASVTTERGTPVVDTQGDIISTEVMQKAAHRFMVGRVSKSMHRGRQTGEVVDSIMFTAELQKALGIDLGREGWFVGVKVHDDATWAKVKDGTFTGFSIGGKGIRTEVES